MTLFSREKLNKTKDKILVATIISFFKIEKYVKIARTMKEKEAVFRFRYECYSKELGRCVPGVDHERKMIFDELDRHENCRIFYVGKIDKILGTIRFTYFDKNNIPCSVVDDYSLNMFENIKNYRISVMERFMVRRELRGSLAAAKILIPVLSFLINKYNVKVFLLSCKPGLVGNYRKFGMFPYTGNFINYPDGFEVPMIGFIDKSRLESNNCLGQYIVQPEQYCDFSFYNNILSKNECVVVEKEKVLNLVTKNAHKFTPEVSEILSPDIIKKLIIMGSYVVNVEKSAVIMHQGIAEHDMFLILNGSVNLYRDGSFFRTAKAGQFVGAGDFLDKKGHRKNKAICENTLLFVIKNRAMDKILLDSSSSKRERVILLLSLS